MSLTSLSKSFEERLFFNHSNVDPLGQLSGSVNSPSQVQGVVITRSPRHLAILVDSLIASQARAIYRLDSQHESRQSDQYHWANS